MTPIEFETWKLDIKFHIGNYSIDTYNLDPRLYLYNEFKMLYAEMVSPKYRRIQKHARFILTEFLDKLRAIAEPHKRPAAKSVQKRRGSKRLPASISLRLLDYILRTERNRAAQQWLAEELTSSGDLYKYFVYCRLEQHIPRPYNQKTIPNLSKWIGGLKETILRGVLTPGSLRVTKRTSTLKYRAKLTALIKGERIDEALDLVKSIQDS